MIEGILSAIGSPVVNFFKAIETLGEFLVFNAKLLPLTFKKPFRLKEIIYQVETIGIKSLGIILLTGTFIGMVQAIQMYQGFHKFGIETMMGYTIFYALGKELAPVIAALMVTSRAISAMSAELGTMRVTEQIDAIDTLAVDSRKLLVIPKIIATTISLPILTVIFNIIANFASYMTSVYILDVNGTSYINAITQFGEIRDYAEGIIKSAFFGFLIGSIGTYFGYHTRGGARGVGIATTITVVTSSVIILVADYFLGVFFMLID